MASALGLVSDSIIQEQPWAVRDALNKARAHSSHALIFVIRRFDLQMQLANYRAASCNRLCS